MNKVLLAVLLTMCFSSIIADTLPNYDTDSKILAMDKFTINRIDRYKNGQVRLNYDGTWELLKSEPDKNTLDNGYSLLIQGYVLDYNGLKAKSIFRLDNGLIWRVLDNETVRVPEQVNNRIIIMKDAYTLNAGYVGYIDDKYIAVEPYLYHTRIEAKLESYYGVSNGLLFQSNGKVWKNVSDIPLTSTVGTYLTIFDNKWLLIEGKTYEIQLVG